MFIIAAATTGSIIMMIIMLILAFLPPWTNYVDLTPRKKLSPDKMLPYEKRLEICNQIGRVLIYRCLGATGEYTLKTENGIEITAGDEPCRRAWDAVLVKWILLQFMDEIKKIDFSTFDHCFLDENGKPCDHWRDGGRVDINCIGYGARYLLYAIGFAKVPVPCPVEYNNPGGAFVLKPIEDVKL